MTETITLGGRQFALRPLKLGQLRRLLDALDALSGRSGGALITAAANVVAAGLAPAYPDLAADALLDLEAGVDELNAAVAAVLRIAGLRPAPQPDLPPHAGEGRVGAEDAMGEAMPVAGKDGGPATSSPPSTAPSPPAAATPTGSSTR